MRKKLMLLLIMAAYIMADTCFAEVDNRLYKATQTHLARFVQDLAVLVNIDSGTDDGKGLAKAEAFLVKRLKKLGAKVEVFPALPSAGKMVVATLQGTGTKNIMLMIHYDTVFASGEALKRPFKVVDNKAYGPGVADAKGGALLILHALAIARERGFKNYKSLSIFFNPDEETGSMGSRDRLKKLASSQDIVLSYEPPEADRVIVATNGIAHIFLAVKGLASHAGSAPEKGRNAAVELSNQIMQLQNLGNPDKGTTVNWTVIKAGDRINIIPDKAMAIADMRLSDLTEIERVQKDANKIVLKKRIPETDVSIKVENRRPPFVKNTAGDNLAELANKIYIELGKSIEPVAMRYGTDAGYAYNPGNNRPAVLEGMGIVGGRIHTSEEWADLKSVSPRLYLTVRMLEALSEPAR